jgi:hypothetical protein
VRASAEDDTDTADDENGSADAQKEPVPPRPLTPEDPIFRKALELLKAPQKKAA